MADTLGHDDDDRTDRLEEKLEEGFRQVDKRFGWVDDRFAEVDKRFAEVDKRFDKVDERFDKMDRDIGEGLVEQRNFITVGLAAVRTELRQGFSRVDARFDRLESKIEAFVEAQTEINRRFAGRLGN